MEQHAAKRKTSQTRDEAAAPVEAKPAGKIQIPELYRRPAGDRDLQGCMKARA